MNLNVKEIIILDVAILDPELEPATTRFAVQGITFTSCVRPAQRARTGGDWCEAFAISDTITVLSIGDIGGKGVQKFSIMTRLRQVIRDAAGLASSPTKILSHAHDYLVHAYPQERATAIVAFLDSAKQTLTFANAGHPAPLLINDFGSSFLEFAAANAALGIGAKVAPISRLVYLRPSSLIVFYTDGVIGHARDGFNGARQLEQIANYAYDCAHRRTAAFIRNQMGLQAENSEDMAILTAWMSGVTQAGPHEIDRTVVYLQQR